MDIQSISIAHIPTIMQINEAVLHRIEKNRHQFGKFTLAAACLQIDKILTDAVEKARKTYGTTASRAFGTFEGEVRLFPFSGLLADYLAGNLDMLTFSGQAMKLLVREMDKQALSTGGYALFVSYQEQAKSYFMVVLLKLRGGVGIDQNNLTLSENFSLDVDHLHEAARINVANWHAADGNYISFVKKGKSDADFTDYFRTFLGCAEFVESKEQTGLLIQTIRDYCADIKLNATESKNMKEKAFNYFLEQSREGKGISLSALSMRFDEKNPAAFKEYIERNGVEISDGFEPHKSTFKKLMRIGGKDADMTISFDIGLIGNRVRYDKATKELRISSLPPGLIAAIESEM